MTTEKKITIDDEIGKIGAGAFIDITLPPPRIVDPEELAGTVFVFERNGYRLYYKCMGINIMPFANVTECLSLMDTGEYIESWRRRFRQKHPSAFDVGVYNYLKCKKDEKI